MKAFLKIFILTIGVGGFLTSCDCKTCKKESEISVQVCKDGGSQDEYDNTIQYYEALNFTCR
jgi:hypothetical protein